MIFCTDLYNCTFSLPNPDLVFAPFVEQNLATGAWGAFFLPR